MKCCGILEFFQTGEVKNQIMATKQTPENHERMDKILHKRTTRNEKCLSALNE